MWGGTDARDVYGCWCEADVGVLIVVIVWMRA